ncbi:hypothetical protein CKY28_02545 [Sphingomonas lenta]|uniref:MPN domain-containing protein n=2 Tax=Sphingomonas lenta TaxID=1141887 RepID=A0A2A2SKJ6_9SPHN|nr:M67 family metallopeptidase [Sphingomonas lenta]PAX09804.1 hypothetical protein CKY28_02545 [Sphingomonas lenta]
MIVRITTETLDAIVTETIAESGREACGLLLGADDRITAHRPARNVADDPHRRFEIDPATLLAAHRAARADGPAILGCYHSHPTGSPDPSARDAADAEPNGWLWLIVGAGEARLWRAVRDGAVHGRFEPVPFTCVSGPPAPESALSG